MPWDDVTQEFYRNSKDPRQTVACAMCGKTWDEEYDRGSGYVSIGDTPVCADKCQWEYIEQQFREYLKVIM